MTSILNTDEADNFEHGIDADATDAFSKLWDLDAEKPSEPAVDDKKKQDKPAPEDTDDEAEGDDEPSEETPEDDDEAEGDEGEDETTDEEGDQPTVDIKDDHKVKVKVDGEDKEFTFGQLKRLAGQEASLTRKSQTVSNQAKQISEQGAVLLAQQTALLDRAKQRYAPYAKLDLLALSKDPNISGDELVAVRNLAQQAYEDVQYLEGETSRVAEALRNQSRKELMEQAQESLKVLSNPETGIEGFNQELYGDICQFAVSAGLPADVVSNLVDPNAIKLINMARLYAKGKTAVQGAKSDKQKAPKRIVKATASAETTKKVIKTAKANAPAKRLQKSGSVDDAAAAFEANWFASED